MSTEKYKQAWKKFQDKMASLRKKQSDIFKRISEKLDRQKIDILRKKIKGDE